MSAGNLCAALAGSVVALLAASASAQSQQSTLTIHVVDPARAPVAGARIAAASRDARFQLTQITDNAGVARFDALLSGSYVVEIDATGFARSARRIAVGPGATTLTISLTLAAIAEHVFVTASGDLQTTPEVAKAVTVVAAEEIDARHEFSVADALRTVPGTTVQQLGGQGSFTSVKLRGMREQDTSILIDGVRFRDAGSPQGDATAFIGELYIASLDRIEVLRGAGSSLYGSHAVGGAVNVITATGDGRPSAEIGAEAGGLGFSRVIAHTGGGAGDRVTFSLGAGRTRTLRGIDGDDDARNTSMQGRGDVRLGASARATVRIYWSDAESAINESPAAIGPLPATGFVQATPATFIPAANDPDNTRSSDFLSTLFLFEHRPSPAFGYTFSLHRVTTDRLFRDGPLGVSAFEPVTRTSSRFAGTIDTLAVRADREWSARQATRFSYEFERERYVSEALPANLGLAWNADIKQDSHAAAVHHEVRFNALQLAGSVRAQQFGLNDVALAPAERAPFAASSFSTPPSALTADVAATRTLARTGTKLRAHAGNAYRAPAMFERAGVSFGSRGYSVFGDPGLGPERSIAVDAGVDQTLANGRALISATWFHTRLTRVVSFQSLDRLTDRFGRSSGYRSADGRTARGVELSTRLHPHRATQVSVAYTFVDAPPLPGGRDGLPRAAAVSAHQFSALVTQRARAFLVSFELEAAGDHYMTLFDPVSFGSRAFRFPAFAKADVAASYRLPVGRFGTRLFGTVENVFDRSYFVQGFRAVGRVVRGGLAVTL
jgi:outer membrane cobalamin receptor